MCACAICSRVFEFQIKCLVVNYVMDTGTSCSALKDEEIQILVTRLQEDVRERHTQLTALQSDVQTIRDQIRERNRERQIFTSNIIHVDEAAVLVAEHEQLRKSLQTKQAELRSLQDGSAQEQRELERDRDQLERMRQDNHHIVLQHQQDLASVEELKKEYNQKQELYKATKPQLEKATQELARHKESEGPSLKHRPARKPFSVRLDRFIMKTCSEAGLQL